MKTLFLLIFSSILLCDTHSQTTPRYTIKDLEILEKQGSYKEFLLHAKDIRPSLRDSHWKSMVRNVGTSFIDKKLKNKLINGATFDEIDKLSNWSTLRSDDFFQLKRSKYAIKFFKECFFLSSAKSCKSRMNRFWINSKQNPELAMDMLNIYSKRITPSEKKNEVLWPFQKVLTNSELGLFYCKKESVKSGLFRFLSKRINIDSTSSSVKKLVEENIHPDCRRSFFPGLKALLTSRVQQKQILAYKVLNSINDLSVLEKDAFYLTYILGNPVKGDLFNYAWKAIEFLGKDYKRRLNALSLLKTLDPLPGKVFSSPRADLKKAILKLLNDNFHEYVDHYASTCIKYLQGKGSFPFGNPTMECDHLFKARTNNKYVDETLKIQFSAIKK